MAFTLDDRASVERAMVDGNKIVRFSDGRMVERASAAEWATVLKLIRQDLADQTSKSGGAGRRGPLRVVVCKDL